MVTFGHLDDTLCFPGVKKGLEGDTSIAITILHTITVPAMSDSKTLSNMNMYHESVLRQFC